MAILKNGLFGSISGKLGNTVTYDLKGKTVVRIIGKKSTKPPTVAQLANWQGMAVVNKFLKQVKLFIDVGFNVVAMAEQMYPQNKAVSVIKGMALTGVYPNIELDFSKVLLSTGDLPGLLNVAAVPESNGIRFTWDPQEWIGWPYANDQVMLMAFMPDTGSANFVLSGAPRRMGYDFLEFPPALLTERMELYISVVSDNRKRSSVSQYLGRIN
ncbi:MAG: DUF6266 family protein [Bacteroidota bacterium]